MRKSIQLALLIGLVTVTIAVVVPLAQPARGNQIQTTEPSRGAASYVGKKVCGECHKENFEFHSKHGHASTFFEISETDISEIYAGKTFDAGKDHGVYQYGVDASGALVAKLSDQDVPQSISIQYVLGSGHSAQTLLALRHDGESTLGVEHRVSCYRDDRLGLTVGHQDKVPDTPLERFGAVIEPSLTQRCVYCHTTTGRVADGKVVDLTAGVNCEKCHGPGSEHVRLARQDPNPPPYSVGKSDWDVESEIQLCGDCHRLPYSISIDELRDYPDLVTRFQPIGMLRSRCYLESDFAMRCTTCHNPHASVHGPGERELQIKHCIRCHDPNETTHVLCPQSTDDGCIECHMPAIEVQQGVKFHDHWIRIRK